jgi:hypothetical protein
MLGYLTFCQHCGRRKVARFHHRELQCRNEMSGINGRISGLEIRFDQLSLKRARILREGKLAGQFARDMGFWSWRNDALKNGWRAGRRFSGRPCVFYKWLTAPGNILTTA